jgi:hypothetical protein
MFVYYFIYSFLSVVSDSRTIDALMFDDLQDLEEQDFEQLGEGKCP